MAMGTFPRSIAIPISPGSPLAAAFPTAHAPCEAQLAVGDVPCLGSRTRWMSHSYQTPPSSITPPAAYPMGLLSALCTQLLLDKQKALHDPTGLPGRSSEFQGDMRAEPLPLHAPEASPPSSSTCSCLNLTIYKVLWDTLTSTIQLQGPLPKRQTRSYLPLYSGKL